MTTHDELVDAGAQAMRDLFNQPGTATNREYAAAVVRAVEEKVRADERDVSEALADLRANARLRAKWKTLDATRDDGIFLRSEIDALFDGSSE